MQICINAGPRARGISAYSSARMWAAGFAVALAAVCACNQVWAQDYPSRAVTVVVPYGPGGGADFVGRVISQSMTRSLKQQVIVDNRAGANGIIGANIVVRAAPDGHTLMLGSNTFAVNVSLYKKLPYDFLKDFVAVSMLSSFPYILVVHPSLPVSQVKDLIALAQRRPGDLFYGSTGNGSSTHLAAEQFKMAVGIRMVHVPYKGTGDQQTDLEAGRVPVAFLSIATVLPIMKSARFRALAVTSTRRLPAAPDLPTFLELGFKDVDVSTWNVLFAPAQTPAEIVSRLNAEAVKAVNDPFVRERFSKVGVDAVSSTPQETAAFMKEEVLRWGKVVKASGATTLD